jgi:hypothetical protein
MVPSQTAPDKQYAVDLNGKTCTCPDHQEAGYKCKHIYACEFTVKRELNVDGTVTETRSLTFTEQKTYSQNWACYNRAQQEEKHRLQLLLVDLCRGVSEPPLPKTGRRPHLAKDAIFAMALKVYCTMSSRRTGCDLQEAHERGHLSKAIPAMKVNQFFENANFTPILTGLITRSSLPLKALETKFAVDSTGFSTSRHARWYDHKYGVEREGREWIKVHIVTGVSTNIIAAAKITDSDTNDSPILPELAKTTATYFHVDERDICHPRTSKRSTSLGQPRSSRPSPTRPAALAVFSRRCFTSTSSTARSSCSATTCGRTSSPPFRR